MPETRLPVYRIPWPQALEWLRSMVRDLREDQDGYGHFDAVHGVPEGGVYPATVVSVALDLPLVGDPDTVDRCIIVDEDAASGETLARWEDELLEGRHVSAVVHARVLDRPVPLTYVGALEECPAEHRLLWPWREGPSPSPTIREVVPDA